MHFCSKVIFYEFLPKDSSRKIHLGGGGPETNFFLRGVWGSANFSFLGPRNQGYFSFLGARCEAGYINTFC